MLPSAVNQHCERPLSCHGHACQNCMCLCISMVRCMYEAAPSLALCGHAFLPICSLSQRRATGTGQRGYTEALPPSLPADINFLTAELCALRAVHRRCAPSKRTCSGSIRPAAPAHQPDTALSPDFFVLLSRTRSTVLCQDRMSSPYPPLS